MVPKYDALPDSADFHIVVASCVQWHGVLQALRVIYDLHTLRRLEQLAHIIRLDGLLGLHDDGLGVCPEGRDSNGSAGNFHIVVQAEDLLQLPSDLHLFLGVAVLLELVDLRNDVERQLVGEEFWLGHFALLHPAGQAILQLRHTLGTSTARGLVGGHQDLLQLVLLVDRPECHCAHCSCAIRIGNDWLVDSALAVNLWDHQGLVLLVAPSRGVIDHLRVLGSARQLLGPFQGEVARHRHETNVALLHGFRGELLHGDLPELGLHGAARRAVPEEPHLLRGEIPVLQAFEHLFAHRARAAQDSHAVHLAPCHAHTCGPGHLLAPRASARRRRHHPHSPRHAGAG
mmetsp:Transcript_36381/g.87021  ORF Transcript_36381/g.87021 Transcript_36381/m.87021 type:complete len:344 (-) Transcript_36381:83-1114(-)